MKLAIADRVYSVLLVNIKMKPHAPNANYALPVKQANMVRLKRHNVTPAWLAILYQEIRVYHVLMVSIRERWATKVAWNVLLVRFRMVPDTC